MPAKTGRARGQTSKPIVRAARKNGKRGGRPPAQVPAKLLAELGPPPTDVLEKDAWWARLLEILQWGDLTGEPWAQKLERACRAAAQAGRLRDGEIKARLAKLMEDEDRDNHEDFAPREVAREKDSIAQANDGGLRRDPP